jgi:amino acid transporter
LILTVDGLDQLFTPIPNNFTYIPISISVYGIFGTMSRRADSSLHFEEAASHPILDGDIESIGNAFREVQHFHQGLHQRHIQMIALAGTIGTGLFLSSGQAIATSGPLGAFLGYMVTGIAVSSVVFAVGEMGSLVPLSGGVVRYAEYFFDPAMSFADGWNQTYSYLVSVPTEIVAAAVLVEFWSTINNAIWVTTFGLLMLITPLVFIRIYGEIEYFFSMLKIALIIGLNIMALVVTCGGGPNGESIGFRYWRNPGPFVQHLGIHGSLGQFLGCWTSFYNAVYAYSGIQNVTAAAAETKAPRHSIPRATKRIFVRIFVFYVLSIFMVGLIIPSNDPNLLQGIAAHPTASQSPFVIAAQRAGIAAIPSIINAVIITSAWSAGNSEILFGSRILFGMAAHGHAPTVFKRLNRFGVPYISVILFGIFMSLGYMSLDESSSTVFRWLQNIVAVSTLVDWGIICIVYLRFYYGCKKQGINRYKDLPWAAPFQPYSIWASLTLFVLLLFTGGYSTFVRGHWSTETFMSSYINIPIILVLYFGYKFWKKTSIRPLETIPISGFVQFFLCQEHPEPEPEPTKGLKKFNVLWS